MAGKSPVTADAEQRSALLALSHSRDRGEGDRARAILLTLSGWTSRQIAQAFGVREDTGRFWRSAFITGGDRGAEEVHCAGASSRQSRMRAGRGRRGPVRAGGGSPELDAAAFGR